MKGKPHPHSTNTLHTQEASNLYRVKDLSLQSHLFPQDGYNYRSGTLPRVIQHIQDLEHISNFLSQPFSPQITCHFAQAVITEEVLRSPSSQLDELVEGGVVSLISLKDTGHGDVADCFLVTFARYAPHRHPEKEQVDQAMARAQAIFLEAREQPMRRERLLHIHSTYSCLRLVPTCESSLLHTYREMVLANFGETIDLDTALTDSETLVMVAVPKSDPTTVVAGVYFWKEPIYLKRDGKDIVLLIYQGDGGVVRPDAQREGLYTVLQQEGLSSLANTSDPPVDLVYGCLDIGVPGALKGTGSKGHLLVTETAADLKIPIMPHRWILHGKATDELIAYLPGNLLRAIYGRREAEAKEDTSF